GGRACARAPRGSRELRQHGDRVVVLGDTLEAVALVELDRACIGAVDAQRERRIAVGTRPLEQRLKKGAADAPATRIRHDRDRELGRALVDETEAGPLTVEEPVPRRADRESPVEGDHGGVTLPSPGLDVEGDGPRPRVRRTLLPVVGVVEHVPEEAHVLRATPANDDLRRLGGFVGAHSASAGCSISATSVCRNCAPSAPSIARWSQVRIIRTIGAMSSSPSVTTGSSFTAPTARI